MSGYRDVLYAAEERGRAAYEAMEAWVNRSLEAPDVPGAVLEGYARELRASREQLQSLLAGEGVRDDIEAALARNERYHRALGLSVRDLPPEAPEDG